MNFSVISPDRENPRKAGQATRAIDNAKLKTEN